ncbi:MAG TPA: sulfotransferase domain-containing protein [Chryseolinea sp.]|nr:sulfotransferase domain-containing protein [Chryseolinea sp.]
MTLPTFLGIGVQRAGTTWLHTLLDSHPEVYMPTRRKEIRFFERYYHHGLDWYGEFFCPPEQAAQYKAIGEISTQYYDCAECPERIFTTLPKSKLIIMLRHPVNRAYSHYGFVVQRRNFKGSFQEFLANRPAALEKGYYSRYLKNYLCYFDRRQILTLLFEEVFIDTDKTKKTIADFLDIAVDKFPLSNSNGKVNASTVPNHQSLYGFVVKTGRRLRKRNLEPVVDFVMRLGIQRFLSKGDVLQPLDKEFKQELSKLYQDEFAELEQCMQINLESWRK